MRVRVSLPAPLIPTASGRTLFFPISEILPDSLPRIERAAISHEHLLGMNLMGGVADKPAVDFLTSLKPVSYCVGRLSQGALVFEPLSPVRNSS